MKAEIREAVNRKRVFSGKLQDRTEYIKQPYPGIECLDMAVLYWEGIQFCMMHRPDFSAGQASGIPHRLPIL
ncbi:hypothetical protein HMPREF9137_2403 [Prevotella denticola F0289]|nr:hypothetical protein HMPREF9137_2403 [Prevotella denticola F0289]